MKIQVDLVEMETFLDNLDCPMPYNSPLELAHLDETSCYNRLVSLELKFKVS